MTTIHSGRLQIATGAVLISIATGLGAIASHGLDSTLEPDRLDAFVTAVNYQFFHSLGLIGTGVLADRRRGGRMLTIAGILITVGIVFFCGGVYSSSLQGPGWISGLAPTGGIALIVGWLLVAAGALVGESDS